MSTSLFSNTPSVTVIDNRGLVVQNIAWYRHPDTPDTTDTRITHHQYDARGHRLSSTDPRLFALQQQDKTIQPNFRHLTSLSGDVMRTESTDAGITVSLNDVAGRPFMVVTDISAGKDGKDDKQQAVIRRFQYEGDNLPGRPLAIMEQTADGRACITERFVYAGSTQAEKVHNLAGQCICHYDTAGLVQTESMALTGVPLCVTRRLLQDAANPGTVVDWQGADASVWNTLLSAEKFTTRTTVDATGTVLTTLDAKGNTQRVAYDVAGRLAASWLTPQDGTEQVIVASLTYSAGGQKLREAHGNGVVTTYTYEPETQRLIGIKTERPSGHTAGAKVLQDLRYTYDPVGNVLNIRNEAEATRFWRNQQVIAENT